MSALDENHTHSRVRSTLKAWVLTITGAASAILAVFAMTRPY